MKKRSSGILLHISSLPSPFGIGDFGPQAYRFVDFLAEAKQAVWQVLPLNVLEPSARYSPYSSSSIFAGNPLFISPELLVKEGLLQNQDLEIKPEFEDGKVDFNLVAAYKEKLFELVYRNFLKLKNKDNFLSFCLQNSAWLEDFALFKTLSLNFRGAAWGNWPLPARDRHPQALEQIKREFASSLEKEKFLQFIFYKQWFQLKKYCHSSGIKILGDIPIYVDYNSCDLWVDPNICKLDKDKKPSFLAGVPPDYFSRTGQLWENPVYDWEYLEKTGFEFWLNRITHNLSIYDSVRLDHFRGLVAFWQVPAGEKTAENGKWVKAPIKKFWDALKVRQVNLPIIAEDLGIITDDVREIMSAYDLPGMKVLLFAFGEDNPQHPYLPHNYISNCVVYTGTHDNNTVRGWFKEEAGFAEKKRLFNYLGKEVLDDQIAWELISLAEKSPADLCILPLQDILGLGSESRMNTPGTTFNNWEWRFLPSQIDFDIVSRLASLTESAKRA